MSGEIVRVGKKYTLVIPKKVRKTLGIKEGDTLKIRIEGDQMKLEKLEDPFEVLEKVIGVSVKQLLPRRLWSKVEEH